VPLFVVALGHRGPAALGIFAAAAASDFADGRLARHAGRATAHGAVLDAAADVVFVLAGTARAAALGLVSWAVPAAIAASAGVYATASLRRSRRARTVVLAQSRLGHVAGVANYAVAGLAAAAVAVPAAAWSAVLAGTGGLVVALNLGAAAARLLTPTVPRART
jgi:phosphatidylglycerophosphate synthase